MTTMLNIFLAAISLALASGGNISADDNLRPNIVFIVIDDMPFLKAFTESAPEGVDLEDGHVSYGDYPTPNINSFRNETLIFPTSFCGGPKCAPARYSILTGRQPTRCLWAIDKTLDEDSGIYGPDISSSKVKMTWEDGIYNIPTVLRNDGYHTGMVGKWQLMSNDDNGYLYGCEKLSATPDAELYAKCKDILKEQGFSFVDAWYYENIADNPNFSHNPEWMVSQSQKFIDNAIFNSAPFFLYFAATLTHTPQVEEALLNYTMYDSPKGQLSGDDVPDDTAMMSRAETWQRALDESMTRDLLAKNTQQFAKFFWLDDMFGALISYLIEMDVYDNTFVVFMSDHGTEAKGTLYAQGSRIMNFVRYPPTFGTNGPAVMPSDFMLSAVDLAATVFEVVGVDPPEEYLLDGYSFLDHTSAASVGDGGAPDHDVVAEGEPMHQDPEDDQESHFDYKYIDIFRSHSIVSARWQYIYRAKQDDVEPSQGAGKYRYFNDEQQLYDLWLDPSQQNNLMRMNGSIANSDYPDIIKLFQHKMRDYIDDICIAENVTECLKPGMVAPVTTVAPPLPSGVECITDNQCGTREMCDDGECVQKSLIRQSTPCNVSDDCESFMICNSDGECQRAHLCWSDLECLEHQTCEEGECVRTPGRHCARDDDCSENQECIKGSDGDGGSMKECRRMGTTKGSRKGFGNVEQDFETDELELFQEDGAPMPWIPLDDESLVGHAIALTVLLLLMCTLLSLRRCWNSSRSADSDEEVRRKLLLLREGSSGYGAGYGAV